MPTGKPNETEETKNRVLLVDDHPMVRERLAELIDRNSDLEVCGEADDAATALQQIALTRPHLVIIDISLKNAHGLELIKNVHALYADLPMLVLSMHDESLYAERCLRAGALGYITKLEATEKVLVAIRQVLSGQIYVSAAISARLVRNVVGKSAKPNSPAECLTDRELEVFQLLGQGLRTRQIAEELKLGTKSVETYRARIKEKLQLQDATELLLHAIQWVHSLEPKKPGT